MNPKISIVQTRFGAKSWRSCLQLLVALAILCCGSLARAQQNDTWTGVTGNGGWSTTNNWTVGGNPAVGMNPTNGDNLIFQNLGANTYYHSTNDFTGTVQIGSITFSTNSYVIGGNALIISNGIVDTYGSNSIQLNLTLGASQTFENTVNPLTATYGTNTQTSIGASGTTGTINLGTNTLTIAGGGLVFLNGLISAATNGGGMLVVNDGGGVARLGPSTGSTGNGFGTNIVSASPTNLALLTNAVATYTNIDLGYTNIVQGYTNPILAGIDYVTNAAQGGWVTNYVYSGTNVLATYTNIDLGGTTNIVVGSTNYVYYSYTTNLTIWTNYSYLTTNGFSTNITWKYVTNSAVMTYSNVVWLTNSVVAVQDVVTVTAGTLQSGSTAAATIPNGAGVGNVWLDGTLDLNGASPTINGLEDSGVGSGVVDNISTSLTGSYTLTVGNANSNGIFSGVIRNTSGTVGLTKTGFGTETLTGPNTYSGPTIVNQGTLALGLGGFLGQNSQDVTVASGAVLDVSASDVSLGYNGYIPSGPLTVAAGTATKPYTNFFGSYYPYYPCTTNYVVTITTNNYVSSNTVVAYDPVTGWSTNASYQTNFLSYSYSTNSIASIVTADVIGDFMVNGGGAISPISTVAPGIATWTIQGNLDLDSSLLYPAVNPNRINMLLNNSTAVGGGTNDLIVVTGQLNIGDELDFVISTVTGSLATGTYTLIQCSNYVANANGAINNGDNDGATLKVIAPRGITNMITSDQHGIYMKAGGIVSPGFITWAGTPAANNWDVGLTKNWKNTGTNDYYYSQDNVTFDDTGVGTVVLPVVLTPSSMTFNNNLTNYAFTASQETAISGGGGITLNGTGSVTLNNPNSFSGDVTINNGTLILGNYGGYNAVTLYNSVAPGQVIFGGLGNNEVFSMNWTIANTSQGVGLNGFTLQPGANAQIATVGGTGTRASNVTQWLGIGSNINRAVGSSLYVNYGTRSGSTFSSLYITNTLPWTNGLVFGGWAHVGTDWFLAQTNFGGAAVASFAYAGYTNITSASAISLLRPTNNISLTGATPLALTASAAVNTLKLTGPAGITISSGMTLTDATGGLLISSASTAASTILGGQLMGAAGADLIILQNATLYPFTIGSVIADNGSATALTLGGLGGTVILTNNNTYTGPTYLNSGTLQVGNGTPLGSISTLSAIYDNGVLAFNRPDATSIGAVSGSGSLTQAGTGTLTLTGNSTLTGLVTISSGTLQLGAGSAAGSVSNAVGIVDNGTLTFNNNNTVSYPNVISGIGNVVQAGTGTLVIATNETYSGNTIVSNGVVKLMPSGSISNTAAIILSGGILNIDPGTLTLRSALPTEILAGSGSIMGSVMTAGGSKLIPGTNGVIGTLSITNTLTLNNGVYDFDIGTNAADRINCGSLVQTSGTLVYNVTAGPLTNGIYTLIYSTNTVSGSYANIALAGFVPSGQLAVLTNSTAHTLDMLVYSGYAPVVYWKGDGTQNYWNATANSYWVDGSSSPVTYASADIINFTDAGSNNTPVSINVSSVYPGVVTVNSTENYTIGDGTTANAANVISGGASLVKSGTGTLTLQSVNTYLGTTTINQGVVQLNGAGTAVSADGMLGSGTVTDNGTLIANNATNETLLGGLVGTGSLVQEGVGTLILAGDNTGFSGPITVSNTLSSLQVGNGFTGTLGTGNLTNNGTIIFDTAAGLVVNTPITGSGGISNVLGTVTLSGNDNYTGVTVINGGTIKVGSATAIPSASALLMNDTSNGVPAGILDLNGNDITVTSLSGTNYGSGMASLLEGEILNNGTTTNILTINGGGTNTFYGQIQDNNNAGTGKVALSVINGTYLALVAPYNNVPSLTPSLFSGGVTVSNATLALGGVNGGVPSSSTAAGVNYEGTAALGGNGNQPVTFTGTNDSFYASAFSGSSSPTIATAMGVLTVTTNTTVWIYGPQRGTVSASSVNGGGNIIFQPNYVRCRLDLGISTNFYGTITFGQHVGTAGGNLGYNNILGFPNADVIFDTNNASTVSFSGATGGGVLPFGSLSGGDNSTWLGGGSNPSGDGTANTIYVIGSKDQNVTNTFGGRFIDNGCGIRKVGAGTLMLTNTQMTFLGQCVVSNGTLAFAPLAPSPSLGYVSNYLVASNFTIVAPGVLDIRAAGCSLNLGGHTNQVGAFITQSLFGDGTLNGDLVASNSMIAPAWGVNSRPPSLGTLTINGSAVIGGLSTIEMYINPTNLPTYDSLVATNGLTINSARLTVATNSSAAFAGGTSNVFRFFPTAVPLVIGNSGGITNITLPNLANSYWVTNLTLDGSMALVVSNTASTNALLSGLAVTPAGALSPAFTSNTLTYAAVEAYVNGSITVTPTDWNANATNYVVYLGATQQVASGSASTALTLNANPASNNVVRVHVTAQDNSTVADYTINVTRNPDRTPGAIVNSYDGTSLTMSWPLSEIGYQLEAQTNDLGTGLSTNWVVVANSTGTNVWVVPVTATNGSVFYRLVNTNTP